MKKKEQGLIANLSSQFKVILILVLIVVSAFALVASFGAGFVSGVIVSSRDTKENCELGGGTWFPDDRICERAEVAVQPDSTPTGDKLTYTCDEGTELEVEHVDPEVVHVTPADGFGTLYILPMVSLGNLGGVYSNGSVRMNFQGNRATYQNEETGLDTGCTLGAN